MLDCLVSHYIILATDCGSCSPETSYTTIICNNVPTNGHVCKLAVQAVFCGNISGEMSRSETAYVNLTQTTEGSIRPV